MDNRLSVQRYLEEVLGSKEVYFQPPSNVTMKYPAIVYKVDNVRRLLADNSVLDVSCRYEATLITKKAIPTELLTLFNNPRVGYRNSFVSDNLYHYVFTIY